MDKTLLFVLNPLAGQAEIKNKLLDIVSLFSKNGYAVTVYPTQKRLDAYHIVQNKSSNYDLLVCSGGDGTLNETVKGLMHCEKRTLLGYIPAGTSNDFAASLDLPKNMLRCAKVAMFGEPFPCDIGQFNDNYFTYIAAFGAFTNVSYQTPQQTKNVFGRLAYIFEGIMQITAIKSYRVSIEYEDNKIEDEFIFGMISNSISVGGFKNIGLPNVVMDDGLFEVFLVKSPKNPIEMQLIINALLMQEQNSFIYAFRTDKLHITSKEAVPWTLDGEYGGKTQCVDIENKKQAITILKNTVY